ncbi:hypothetical protein JCM18909_3608 [Cutibacterium acnes JCM 18909]|nr:hypothetical protein JCM18909_3608 [Cutibacterium acnes JCM 18909]
MIKGLLSTVSEPDAATLAKLTATVEKNNTANDPARSSAVPNQIGTTSSKIKHVIYIVRENRTFDQELGSNGRGNADPSLNLFGEESAPNTRALARQFTTFDNFYADAEVSANGWNWVSQANSNPWSEEMWPSNYSGRGAPYPAENNDPESRAKKHDSYFWEHLSKNNISFRNYGFYTTLDKKGKAHGVDKKILDPNTDHDFIGWTLDCPDSARSFAPMAKKTAGRNLVLTSGSPTSINSSLREACRRSSWFVSATTTPRPPKSGSRLPSLRRRQRSAIGQLVETVSHSPSGRTPRSSSLRTMPRTVPTTSTRTAPSARSSAIYPHWWGRFHLLLDSINAAHNGGHSRYRIADPIRRLFYPDVRRLHR